MSVVRAATASFVGRSRFPQLSAIAMVGSVLAAASVLLRASAAQESRGAQQSPSSASAPANVQQPRTVAKPLIGSARERAIAVLRRHAKRSRGVEVLVADYVQRRTTSLRKRPLVSSGAFLFASTPGCVVFRASAPRVSTVRLTATTYEVYRPSRKRLERFRLDAPELSEGLFAALRGDAKRLERDFELVGCDDAQLPARPVAHSADAAATKPVGDAEAAGSQRGVRVVLVPKVAGVRDRLRDLVLTFVGEGEQLRSIAYCDRAGDRVEIELRKQRRNPADAPSAKLAIPDGTRVLEHDPRDR